MVRDTIPNRWRLALAAVMAVAVMVSASSALARVRLDLGLRLELLSIDEGLQFSCDCDTEADPDCERVNDPDFCVGAQLDQAYDGFLVGALFGVNGETETFSGGLRISAGLGSFDPSDEPDGAGGPDRSIALGHIAFELPLEAHVQLGHLQLYAQVVPRVGLLNYFADEDTEESADTFTFGGLFVLGVRLGNPEGLRVGVAAGRVQHPSFGGWVMEAIVSPNITDDVAEAERQGRAAEADRLDGQPVAPTDGPAPSPPDPADPAPPVGPDGFTAPPAAAPPVGPDGFTAPPAPAPPAPEPPAPAP